MKIELDETLSGTYRIDAYSTSGLVINQTPYTGSLIVTPEEIIHDWPPQSLPELTAGDVQVLADRAPEVLLLGTGSRLQFPDNSVLEPLLAAHVGFEIMDTGAACRAYNFLVGEGRRVMAALFMIEEQ